MLYWEIGAIVSEKQEMSNWGSNIIERLAQDLQNSFPGIEGFSRRNIFRMKAFYEAYCQFLQPKNELVPQAVALIENLPIFHIPWSHNALLKKAIIKISMS